MTADAATRDPGLTEQQRLAVETRHVSVSLSAGAGCGKTFVLTERFLDYFNPGDAQSLEPSQLSHLVAITFTERAAREMRDRVRQKCYRRLAAATPDEADYWAELLRSLDNARISTIHSFCGWLLRWRAVEAGIDPQFEVLEQAQADTLLSEVIDDEARRLIAERDETALELAVRFDLDALRQMLRRLVLDCREEQFTEWLSRSAAEQMALWEQFHREKVLPAIVRQIVASEPARQLLRVFGEQVPANAVMQSRRDVLLAQLAVGPEAMALSGDVSAWLAVLRDNARVQAGGGAGAWDSPETYAVVRDAAGNLRKLVDAVEPLVDFDVQSAAESAEVGRQLLAIAAGVARSYAERKQQLGAMDFNDLLAQAHRLLVDPRHDELRRRLASQIRLLLVDEFQDTDPLQVELVEALCGEAILTGKLFFVGDYKQSIYRFRGAEPHVFRQLRERTPEGGQLSLTKNFRSQPAILEFVNALFWHDLGDDYEALHATRAQVTATPTVEFLWARAADDNAKQNKEALRDREADWIARRMRALLDEQKPIVWDAEAAAAGKPRARGAQPGDIAILFRALSNVEAYEAALRRHGIDYYLVGGHAFYAQQEIFDLVNLLRTLHSPSDVVSLVGSLRSGFFSLADETIFWLSQHPEGLAAGLFAAEYPAELASGERARARFAAATIAELRSCKDRLRICELIERALARTAYDAALLNEFLGERKLANLRKLIEQARAFDRSGFFSLADFIAQLSEFVVRQPDEPLAATHSENTNVVRLMTIHQSKGLEFPIVIVPDVDRAMQHRASAVQFDAELGPLVKLPEDAQGNSASGGYELWRFLEREEELAEMHRLLYVATTRAADFLILSSGVEELGAAKGPWMKLLARRFDLTTGNLIGPLPPHEPRPEIRVTTEEPAIRHGGEPRNRRVDLEKLLAETAQADVSQAPGEEPPGEQSIEPIPPDVSARRQYSFSRLAGTLGREHAPAEGFDAGDAAAGDPRRLGTLTHEVLAAIDFADPGDWRSLVALHAERNADLGSADVDEATAMIERFLNSPRARDLAAAAESHGEVEFLLAWPVGRAGASNITLSGYLDRLYRDTGGRWHVLDFKTNPVSPSTVASQAAAYDMQMLVYGLATEQILGSAPADLALHFLRSGDEHAFAWDDAARQRVIALVDAGIAAVTSEPASGVKA